MKRRRRAKPKKSTDRSAARREKLAFSIEKNASQDKGLVGYIHTPWDDIPHVYKWELATTNLKTENREALAFTLQLGKAKQASLVADLVKFRNAFDRSLERAFGKDAMPYMFVVEVEFPKKTYRPHIHGTIFPQPGQRQALQDLLQRIAAPEPNEAPNAVHLQTVRDIGWAHYVMGDILRTAAHLKLKRLPVFYSKRARDAGKAELEIHQRNQPVNVIDAQHAQERRQSASKAKPLTGQIAIGAPKRGPKPGRGSSRIEPPDALIRYHVTFADPDAFDPMFLLKDLFPASSRISAHPSVQ
jgi:hypothetical protein